ncbi:Glu-tRNA(Gln) amidotransferase subunit GatE [Candidatus Pacearchaeota archaeon]|nr:Glu-tRNA(Gln) amidotransferase subunit GatE [Candidatus Pacearchaeota archaeon]
MLEKLDYKKLGLKCGLEVHQQLDTKKLFCNCPSILRRDEPEFEIKRKLHVVAGESGNVDVAAEYQASLNKDFVYQGYDTNCLVELDEEPPHEINMEALKIALQISVLLHAKIFPLTQIMRKTVINGSNTSGFQRTVMIARDGYIETDKGRVGIEGIFLEEDAARIIDKSENTEIYRLDRLGIPLVEIATAPDIKTPEQAKEVALCLGDILRSCKVRRGLGTIRQDINISISGGERVEIKGFQNPKVMVKTINNEIKRQSDLIKQGKKWEPEVRNSLPDGGSKFLRPMPGAARMYPETDLPLLKISRNLINEAKRDLPKLRSEIEKELMHKGLNQEMIRLLLKRNKINEFRELLDIFDNSLLIGKILLMFPKEIARRANLSLDKVEEILGKDVLIFVMESLKNKKISKEQVKQVLIRIVEGKKLEDAIMFEKEDSNIIEEKIRKIMKEKPGLSEKAYMGLVMKEYASRINGRTAMEIIKKYIA